MAIAELPRKIDAWAAAAAGLLSSKRTTLITSAPENYIVVGRPAGGLDRRTDEEMD